MTLEAGEIGIIAAGGIVGAFFAQQLDKHTEFDGGTDAYAMGAAGGIGLYAFLVFSGKK